MIEYSINGYKVMIEQRRLKSAIFVLYHNKIFITTAEFNGLSSTAYGNGILLSERKILVKI